MDMNAVWNTWWELFVNLLHKTVLHNKITGLSLSQLESPTYTQPNLWRQNPTFQHRNTKTRHWTRSQSCQRYNLSLRFTSMLSYHRLLGYHGYSFPRCFAIKLLYTIFHFALSTCQAHRNHSL